MSYPNDLEEYLDSALHNEIERRNNLRLQGLCSYCQKPLWPNRYDSERINNPLKYSDPPCKQHEVKMGMIGNVVLVERI